MRLRVSLALALTAAAAAAVGAAATVRWSPKLAQACDFGRPIGERVLLRPRAGTFYSVDALNPDVVRRGGRYFLYFSGNSARTSAGRWGTGMAVASSPLGPYRVSRRMLERFYNGGTAVVGRQLFQGATEPQFAGPALYRSGDGYRWKQVGLMPAPPSPSWRSFQSDLSLASRDGGLDVYFAGRPAASGADLGVARYERGRWGSFRRVLSRGTGTWDSLDLGEPATFRARGRTYMVYGGLGGHGQPRHVGLAYRSPAGWRRCGSAPFIKAGGREYRANAVDPEPLVVGQRLHVFFAGGQVASLGGAMDGVILVRTYRLD